MQDKTPHDAGVSFSPITTDCASNTTFFIFLKLTLHFKLTFHWDVKNSTCGNWAFSFSLEWWLTLGEGLGLNHLKWLIFLTLKISVLCSSTQSRRLALFALGKGPGRGKSDTELDGPIWMAFQDTFSARVCLCVFSVHNLGTSYHLHQRPLWSKSRCLQDGFCLGPLVPVRTATRGTRLKAGS